LRLSVLALVVLLCACDSDSKSSSDGDNGSNGDTRPPQQGNRLAWEQFATSHAEVLSFVFRLYVDGDPRPLNNVQCATAPVPPYTCSAPLPALSVGFHTLMLSAVSGTLESSPSAPVHINIGGLATSSAEIAQPPREPTLEPPAVACVIESARVCHQATLIVRTTDAISSPAALDNERALYVEGDQEVRVVVGLTLVPEPALTVDSSIRIIGVAVDSAFETTHHVYLATIERADGGSRNLIVARYREVGNQLGERAVVVSEKLAATGDPQVALDGQNRIYIAIPASETSLGQLVRFTSDGWTPSDQREARLTVGFDDPTAIAVERSSGRIWLAGRNEPGAATLRSLSSASRVHELVSAVGAFESLATSEPDERTGSSSLFGVTQQSLRRFSIDATGKMRNTVLEVPSGEPTAVGRSGRTNILLAMRHRVPAHGFTLWRIHLDRSLD
jgi:hypothetical protein